MTLPFPPTGLFANVDAVINARLGVRDYRTKMAAKNVVTRDPGKIVGSALVEDMFGMLHANWLRLLPSAKGSSQNFRFAPQLKLSDENSSPEVTIERGLIRCCKETGRRDWSNQVPLISGFSGPYANKRMAVDLVRQLTDGGFEFVELKIKSDTPLYATLEVLRYGMLWLLSRVNRVELGYGTRILLDSPALTLSTLAPAEFYVGGIPWNLIEGIDQRLFELGQRQGVVMRLRLTAFPDDFAWPAADRSGPPMRWLDERVVLTP